MQRQSTSDRLCSANATVAVVRPLRDAHERNREIAAVTSASLKRAAERAFGDGALHTTVVGKPEGF
jgi:predicted Zn-dependent peptidase